MEKEVMEMIEKRRKTDPEFRNKYDAFLARRGAEGKLSDSALEEVSGGESEYGSKRCPRCGRRNAVTVMVAGVYAYCHYCDYTEWFAGM